VSASETVVARVVYGQGNEHEPLGSNESDSWLGLGGRLRLSRSALARLGLRLGLVAFASGSAFGLAALGAGTGHPRTASSDSALALVPVRGP
jgi:hypothetical protein